MLGIKEFHSSNSKNNNNIEKAEFLLLVDNVIQNKKINKEDYLSTNNLFRSLLLADGIFTS